MAGEEGEEEAGICLISMGIEDTAGEGVGIATQTAYAGVGLHALNKASKSDSKKKKRRRHRRALKLSYA